MPRKSKKTETHATDSVSTASARETAEHADLVGDAVPDFDAAQDVDTPVVLVSQAVTLRLDDQLYGLPIEVVQEIQQLVELTPLPDAAAALVGLIDLRGLVVPAIDLRTLLGLPQREYTLETPMVFCRVRHHVVCLIADCVEDVVELPADGLQPPESVYGMADRMLGTFRSPQGLVLMLDISRLVPEDAIDAADGLEGGRP